MDRVEFIAIRKKLQKTQKQMASLLGVSLKAVHSYEQGWRVVPVHAERQMLFLAAGKQAATEKRKPCWVVGKCPPERKKQCPAWEFQAGRLCWFINGTICDGRIHSTWKKKMEICRSCEAFRSLY